MNTRKLAGLEPQAVFHYFEDICAIPHGSYNTKAISDYLVAFAKAHDLRYIQDSLNNVILFGDATPGYEDHAPVIIQGHMDMVCVKEPDCPKDLTVDPIDVTHNGEFVYAEGTSLGADDGIAVAFALALLADPTIPRPALEVVVTVDEETGMEGASGIDLSMLKGRRLLNIDHDEEGTFTVSCAGGVKTTVHLPVKRRAVYGPCVRLTVEGLKGGHSGGEIHKPLANANKVMAEFLGRIQQIMPVCITKLSGGEKDNAIPSYCHVTMVALGMYIERINDIAEALQKEIRENYDEPDAIVRGDDVDALGGNALTTEDSAKVIALMNALPNGIQAWSQEIEGLVQTSLNMGVSTLTDELQLTFALRSSVNREKEELKKKVEEVAAFYGASCTHRGEYPAWEYKKESALRDTMVRVYADMYGEKPGVFAIHAGLECGLLSEKIEGLDCISLGPQAYDIHTPRERLSIASTQRFWKYLQEVLKNL